MRCHPWPAGIGLLQHDASALIRDFALERASRGRSADHVCRAFGRRQAEPAREIEIVLENFRGGGSLASAKSLERHAGRVAFADGDRRRLLRVQSRGENNKKNSSTLHARCDWQKREAFATYDL